MDECTYVAESAEWWSTILRVVVVEVGNEVDREAVGASRRKKESHPVDDDYNLLAQYFNSLS